MNLVQRLLVAIISLYQKTLSPDHGWLKGLHPHGFCRYHPTCSQYASQAVARHGAIKGMWLAASRVARCNPFNRGGADPVPQ